MAEKKRAMRSKHPNLAFLKRQMPKQPLTLLFWLVAFTFFGALLGGGSLGVLLSYALNLPDPASRPIFDLPGGGRYDTLVFLLPGLAFTWIFGIPFMRWASPETAAAAEQTSVSL